MHKIIKEIPINIKHQHRLLNLLSEGYGSLSKALMEYIDNAFDSAEDFYNEKTEQYTREVNIEILINRTKNEIIVRDNCEGMNFEIICGLANSINESEKKRREQKRAWVNGQFGLGAHAFRFFAQELRVTSQQKDSKEYSISIDRDKENANLIQPPVAVFDPSGTLVELCEVDKYEMRHLNPADLKKDIEVYFEMLLRRNVQIKITDENIDYICQPFNYDELSGLEIHKIINSWYEGKIHHVVREDKGIMVNLKICMEKIDRPPFFSRKGRRINYISRLESFIRKTEHRQKVWEHYYLTGYIEVQDNLEPVITRDDFAGGKGMQQKRTGIYNEIVKVEDAIYAAIQTINKDKSDESLRSLASQLTDILSRLAKEEEMNLNYQNAGNKLKKKDKEEIILDPNSNEEYGVRKKGPGGEGPNESDQQEIVKGKRDPKSNIGGTRIEKQKQGVKIEFSTLPSDERSHYGDGVITVFTSHKDFQDRKGSTHQAELGSMKVTARLANYLAAVISSEFKEIFYQQKKLEPSRKLILNEQIDFIFRLEDRMKDFIDKPLHSIGQLNQTE